MGIGDLVPTAAEVDALRRGKPLLKGASRLQATEATRPLMIIDDKTLKRTVRTRDGMCCRKCQRKVEVLIARVAKRAEVHHVYGRRGEFRFDDRFCLLLCLECHELVTGRVNQKWIVVAVPTSVFLLVNGRELIDCRGPLGFERVA